VTIVRAAFVAGSVRFRVNVPTAATESSVVRANLWIAKDPVSAGAAAASPSGAAGGVPTVPVTGTTSRPGVGRRCPSV
jgi:hypothetical protein